MLVQLDLFENKSEVEILEDRVRLLEKSMDKQRKSLFARNGELAKKYMELHDRMEVIERNICKGF